MKTKLRMTGKQHARLMRHLLPDDGKEAVAVLLCGRRAGANSHILTVSRVELIPYEACRREIESISWPTALIASLIKVAAETGAALVKIHSHPGGYERFSSYDDRSDADLFTSVHGWTDSPHPHASVVMLPEGKMFGRTINDDGSSESLDLITVVGDDLRFFIAGGENAEEREFTKRHSQAFGKGTTALLRNLTVAVVGCSGTGSIVIEQLVRLGVARIILIDPDKVEEKNLNRILNARRCDIGRWKVDVLAESIRAMGLGTEVVPLARNLFDPVAVLAVAESDAAFGCMDGTEGRHLLNRLSAFYSLPYFDVGVRLEADGVGGVNQICGSVNYLQPDGSSLLSRKLITREAIDAEGLKRTNPTEYGERRKVGYIAGVNEDRPAVISVNMHYGSLAVLEFLARIHPYRDDGNAEFAWHGSTLTGDSLFKNADGLPCPSLSKNIGLGDVSPLLFMSSLEILEAAQ